MARRLNVGARRGVYALVSADPVHTNRYGNTYVWQCTRCGAYETLNPCHAQQRAVCRHNDKGCYERVPGEPERAHGDRREPQAVRMSRRGRVSPWTRYEDDRQAQLFVDEHPDGATLDEVGDALGLTRERVRQIEAQALQRLSRRRDELREAS